MSLDLDPLRDLIDVRGVPVEQLATTTGRYLGAVVDDAWINGPTAWLSRADFLGEEEMRAAGYEKRPLFPGDPVRGDVSEYVKAMRPDLAPRMVPPDEANERARKVGLRYDRPVPESFLEAHIAYRRRTLANQEVFQRIRADGNYGTMTWLAAGGAEVLMTAADPVALVTTFMPVVREARYALWAARYGTVAAGAARGVIEGAVGNALLEGLVAPARAHLDPDYTMAEAMLNIAIGGAFGGGLHLAGSGIGAAWRAGARTADRVGARRASRPLDPVERQIEGELGRFSDDASPRLSPMAKAVDELAPETRDTALRASLAQLHAERSVDVASLVGLDPKWKAPTADATPPLRPPSDPADAASMTAHAQLVARAFTDATAPMEPPAGFAPSPDVVQMAARIRAGRPAQPVGREPQTLSQWVAAQGGVMRGGDGAGELLGQDLGRLVRNRENGGRALDDLALAAVEAGFYPQLRDATGPTGRPDLAKFIDDIVDDAGGRRRTYSDIVGADAWRAARDANAQMATWLKDHLNVDPRALSVRQLQYLLSLPEQMARDQALLRRVQLIERASEAESLAAVKALDDDLARAIRAEEDALRERMQARRQSLEPEEVDAELGHRLQHERPVTLEELEALHAERERLDLAGREGRADGGSGGRPGDGARLEAAGVSDDAAGAAASGAPGLRRAQDGRAEGAEARVGETPPLVARAGNDLLDGVNAIAPPERARGGDASAERGFDLDARKADAEDWVRRQGDQTVDRHADAAASQRAARDAASPDLDPKAELAALLERDGKLLTDADRAALEIAGRPHDEMALATEALANCRVGAVV